MRLSHSTIALLISTSLLWLGTACEPDGDEPGAEDAAQTVDTTGSDTSPTDSDLPDSSPSDVGESDDVEDADQGGDTATEDTSVEDEDTAVTDSGADTADTSPTDTDTTPMETDSGGDSGADATSSASWQQCQSSSDCILRKNNCCGWCGNASMSDLDAVNKNRVKIHENAVCPSGPSGCPKCLQGPIPAGFEARCRDSQCRPIDLSAHTSCTKDTDCVVEPLECCRDCQTDTNPDALVAIHKKERSKVQNLLCQKPHRACLRCPFKIPSTKAVCRSGNCQLATSP